MSVTSNTSSQRRNDSGELVVFEAARYFSGGDENACYHNSSWVATADGGTSASVARMSLDMPAINRHNLPTIQKQYLMREKNSKKKCKQPSSPGGRLASFLNSLFNQANSKKKTKSKTSAAAAADGGEDDHRTHDRRRSSISHFGITTSAAAANYNYDSNSAAVTPPSRGKTPTKSSYLKSFSDRQKAVSPHLNGENNVDDENERFRFDVGRFRNPRAKCTADDEEDQRKFGKLSDDGEDSDSSSDLFDLPNLDFYSSGLPVYGTTDMDRIRIGAPISTV